MTSIKNLLKIIINQWPLFTDIDSLPNILYNYLSSKFTPHNRQILLKLIEDTFPNSTDVASKENECDLIEIVQNCIKHSNLHTYPNQIRNILHLNDAITAGTGIILIGVPGSGKSVILSTLSHSLNELYTNIGGPHQISIKYLSPKANQQQIFGGNWRDSNQWHDGILRSVLNDQQKVNLWIVFDGPIDLSWADNLNTALDENKIICFENSERIIIDDRTRFIFEVDNIDYASPSVISRCAIIWIDSWRDNWLARVKWLIHKIDDRKLCTYLKTYVFELFENHFEQCLVCVERNFEHSIQQSQIIKIDLMCTMLASVINESSDRQFESMERNRSESILLKKFIWCLLWAIGGALLDASKTKYEQFIRKAFGYDPLSK